MVKKRVYLVNAVALSLFAGSELSLKNASKITKRVTTDEGFLLVSGTVSRPGIYEYYVGEIPPAALPERFKNSPPDTIVKVLYPDEAVFDKAHLDSIVNKPVTWGHPSEMVNSRNVTFFQRGFIRDKVKEKNGLVTANLVIQDAELINAIEKDKQEELSTGVDSEIDWDAGNDATYGSFDGKVSNIRVNHVAVVSKGRAGQSVRLENKQLETTNKGSKMEKEITINGVTFMVSNQVAQAVEQMAAGQLEMSTRVETLSTELANAKTENETLQGKFDSLEEKLNDTAGLDKLAADRQELVNKAKALCPKMETAGKANGEIIKEVVVTLTNSKMDGQSDAYIQGRFDGLANEKPVDPKDKKKESTVLHNTHAGDGDGDESKADKAFQARNQKRKNAWKPQA